MARKICSRASILERLNWIFSFLVPPPLSSPTPLPLSSSLFLSTSFSTPPLPSLLYSSPPYFPLLSFTTSTSFCAPHLSSLSLLSLPFNLSPLLLSLPLSSLFHSSFLLTPPFSFPFLVSTDPSLLFSTPRFYGPLPSLFHSSFLLTPPFSFPLLVSTDPSLLISTPRFYWPLPSLFHSSFLLTPLLSFPLLVSTDPSLLFPCLFISLFLSLFTGLDPSTDLRGCGFLGLLTTLYLVTEHRTHGLAMDIYKLSQHETQNFPFSIMSINITRIALQTLREEKLNKWVRQ